MIRGTTPTHTFTLGEFDVSTINKVKIIYAQAGNVILTKTVDASKTVGSAITIRLTQEETLMFDHMRNVEIQLRVLLTDGTALASAISHITAGRLLENEVFT